MDRKNLEAASAQGIISKDQVEALLNFVDDGSNEQSGDNSEEQLRFVRGFGDIFITLGIVFVTIATAQLSMSSVFNLIPIVILVAATEWLVRIRRLVLPGITLLIAILFFASRLSGFTGANYGLDTLTFLTVLAFLFYLRYKMPFSLVPIALGIISVVSVSIGFDIFKYQYTFAIYGLLVFFTAMWFDSRDTERKNRLSDSAFWLHLLAAPLVVHGVMFGLLATSENLPYKEVLIIVFFVTFFLVALYVDRRALLVSSLSYAIYASIGLARNNELNIENLTLTIFIVFGVFIIFFGVYWYKIRNVLFSKLNNTKSSRYVPSFDEK